MSANVRNYETPHADTPAAGRVGRALRRGPIGLLKSGVEFALWLVRKTWQTVWFVVYGTLRQAIPTHKRFTLAKISYSYFYHRYGVTWRNERTVEVPIALAALRERQGQRVLEFGHVLGHYSDIPHDVLDKYEAAPGVINQDIVGFTAEPYDAVIGVSTLEHVGWDENDRRPEKLLEAFTALKKLVKPGGLLLLTIPVGYNPFLDRYLETGEIAFDELRALKRISRFGDWEETNVDAVRRFQYDRPYPAANAVLIGTWRQPVR